MPFLVGQYPIRRTLDYLKSGILIFRESVKIFSVNYGRGHKDVRDFVFWHFPQIQYKNPTVQCITFKNLTPTPFIRIFMEDRTSILIDVDCKSKEEIINHLKNFTAVCKTKKELSLSVEKPNYSHFGVYCKRHCMCEILGQVPCTDLIPVPKSWRDLKRDRRKINPYVIPQGYMEANLEPIENDSED